ncbi:MAG: hypothetical protein AAFQ53_17725 [Bacteroidota bacterium]
MNRYQILLSVLAANGTTLADSRKLAQMLASGDPAQQAKAGRFLNLVGAAFTQHLLSAGRVSLSAPGIVSDGRDAGIPIAVQFGEADRFIADTSWRELFTVQDRRSQTDNLLFRIADAYSAVEFKVYQQGERIELRPVESKSDVFEGEIVAGGLQWNQLVNRQTDIALAGEILPAMNARYAEQMAEAAFAVLTSSAGGLQTVAFDSTGANDREQVVNTINDATSAIKEGIYKQKAPKSKAQTKENADRYTFGIITNSFDAALNQRILRALNANLAASNDNQSVGVVVDNVVPYMHPSITKGEAYITIRGRKNVTAVFADLQVYDEMDARIAGIGENRVGQGIYKHVRGDVQQVRKVAFSA